MDKGTARIIGSIHSDRDARQYSTSYIYVARNYREKYAYTLLYAMSIVSGVRFNSDLWSLVSQPPYNEKWITSVWTGTKERTDV